MVPLRRRASRSLPKYSIQFDTTNEAIGKAWQVNYSLQYLPVPIEIQEKDHFRVSFLNKAKHWKYELEYRIVARMNIVDRPDNDFVDCDNLSYVNVGAESLIGIIRGHEFRDSAELDRLVAFASHKIEIWEARTRQDRYELDIVQIK